MLILPAIDLRGGQCVRLKQGDYAQETIYSNDPVAVAKSFEDEGAEWLHVVDLDGARSGTPENLDALRDIAMATNLKIEFGGGIRSLESAQAALHLGAKRVVVGTKLVQDEVVAAQFFAELGSKAVAGIDCKSGLVAIHGWTSEAEVMGCEFAERMEAIGARRVIFTDVSVDGMLTGPNFEATKLLVQRLQIPVIASGGVASLDDLDVLKALGVEGVVVGKAIYEKRFTVREAVERFQTTSVS